VTATRQSLLDDLRRLGLEAGDVVLQHPSFKALGPVAGGPAAALDALLAAVGPAGTLLAFVSWDRSPYDAFVSGPGLARDERAAWPAFDPSAAGVDRAIAGVLGGLLAGHPAAARSANPDLSFAAVGREARALVEGHALDHGFGPGSPLDRLAGVGGKVLLLGAPLGSATIVHHAEYLCDVPGKLTVEYEVPILVDGRKIWRPATQLDSNGFLAVIKARGEDHVAEAVRAYLPLERHRDGRVGRAWCHLFDAADLLAHAVRHLECRYRRG
jgi:aminoglycoside N3'-acetyltransferase